MSNIFGAEPEVSANQTRCVLPVWACWVQFVAVILILIHVALQFYGVSNFENMPDYGIGQRGDVIAAVPSYEETSLRQKVDQWTKPVTTSQLTGSRDVPVFFQDYDVEMARRSAGSAVGTTREGFENGRGEEELERALAGRN